MAIHRRDVCLLTLLLLAPAAVRAQVAKERTSEDTAAAAARQAGKKPDLCGWKTSSWR